MGSKAFLLFAIAFVVVLLITSKVAAAKELAFEHDNDRGYNNSGGRGGFNNGGGRLGYNNGGGHGRSNNGYGKGAYGRRGHGGVYCSLCRYGCCGGGSCKGRRCRCCSTYAEATAYKQTQN